MLYTVVIILVVALVLQSLVSHRRGQRAIAAEKQALALVEAPHPGCGLKPEKQELFDIGYAEVLCDGCKHRHKGAKDNNVLYGCLLAKLPDGRVNLCSTARKALVDFNECPYYRK